MKMKPVAAERKVVIVTPGATDDDLTGPDAWIFRVIFPDSAQGAALATFARRDLDFTKVAIVFDSRHSYSVNLARRFKEDYERLGGTIVLEESFTQGAFVDGARVESDAFQADLKRIVDKLIETNPELVFSPIYPEEASFLVRTAGRAGLAARFASSDGWDNETVWLGSGSNLEGCFLTGAFSRDDSDPAVQRFIQWMEQGTDSVDTDVAMGYDAVTMIVEAMRSTGTTSEEIRQGLRKLKDFPLVSGRMTITPDGETEREVVILKAVRVSDGVFQPQMVKRVLPESN